MPWTRRRARTYSVGAALRRYQLYGATMSMFGGNIYLLIGLLMMLALALLVIIALWTSIKIWLGHMALRRAERQRRCDRFRSDGKPYPPASRGICHRCGRSVPKVYHLPSGERLCPDDYEALHGQENACGEAQLTEDAR